MQIIFPKVPFLIYFCLTVFHTRYECHNCSYLPQTTAKDSSVSPEIEGSGGYWREEGGGGNQVSYSQGYSELCHKFGGHEGHLKDDLGYRGQEGPIKQESGFDYSEGYSGSDGFNSGWREEDWGGRNGDSRTGGVFRRPGEDFNPGAWTLFPPWPAHHNQGEQSHSTAIQC